MEPRAAKNDKNCTKLALKFEAAFGMYFGNENIEKWVPTGSQMEGKVCQKRAKIDHKVRRSARS